MKSGWIAILAWSTCASLSGAARPSSLHLSREAYLDRVHAAWLAQVIGMLAGYQFEHKQGAAVPVDRLPERFRGAPLDHVPLDDDWYYEIVALRAFEKYGIGMSVAQLGRQWVDNRAGFWSTSKAARELLEAGIEAPFSGHPKYNRYWSTIGAQLSAEIYGLVAPGMPNAAAALGREMGHVQGYAEGADGSAFVAGMVSLAFSETDPKRLVRRAATLIPPESPYRQALIEALELAGEGAPVNAVTAAIQRRWGPDYQTTNSAVINGAVTAMAVWSGEGDLWKTINAALLAGDFTDAGCNAATAAAVVGAMRGMRALPKDLVSRFNDRIRGEELAGVRISPPLDETVSGIAERTVRIGEKLVAAHGGMVGTDSLAIVLEEPRALPPEVFTVAGIAGLWDPSWRLSGAAIGHTGEGLRFPRGATFVEAGRLVTFPRDEVMGVVLSRTVQPVEGSSLALDVGADSRRAWLLEVFAGNDLLLAPSLSAHSAPLRSAEPGALVRSRAALAGANPASKP